MDLPQSLAYVHEVFDDYLRVGGFGPEGLTGSTILEIGTGDSLGVALLMIGSGALRVVCLDRFAIQRDPGAEQVLLAALAEPAPPEVQTRMRGCFNSGYPTAHGMIRRVAGLPVERASDTLTPGTFDLIVSRAVFEHVSDIEAAYVSCLRLLRPGGRMIHKVDLSGHSQVEPHPLHFLTYSDRLWAFMSSNLTRINRRRWSHHRVAILKAGFRIERFLPTAVFPRHAVDSIRPRLSSGFKDLSDEDLAIAGFFVVCRVS